MRREGGALTGWGRRGLASVEWAGRQCGAEIDRRGGRAEISGPPAAAQQGWARLPLVHTRGPRPQSPRWLGPERPRVRGRAGHSLTVFVSFLSRPLFPRLLPTAAAMPLHPIAAAAASLRPRRAFRCGGGGGRSPTRA